MNRKELANGQKKDDHPFSIRSISVSFPFAIPTFSYPFSVFSSASQQVVTLQTTCDIHTIFLDYCTALMDALVVYNHGPVEEPLILPMSSLLQTTSWSLTHILLIVESALCSSCCRRLQCRLLLPHVLFVVDDPIFMAMSLLLLLHNLLVVDDPVFMAMSLLLLLHNPLVVDDPVPWLCPCFYYFTTFLSQTTPSSWLCPCFYYFTTFLLQTTASRWQCPCFYLMSCSSLDHLNNFIEDMHEQPLEAKGTFFLMYSIPFGRHMADIDVSHGEHQGGMSAICRPNTRTFLLFGFWALQEMRDVHSQIY